MTLKTGHYAILSTIYDYEIGRIARVTAKTANFVGRSGYERRVMHSSIAAYSFDRDKLQKTLDRLTSASAEATRRVRAANLYEREEHARIIKEAMA